MEKIDAFKKEYYRDPQVIAMMTTKFVTRYQIWNSKTLFKTKRSDMTTDREKKDTILTWHIPI